jgi:hypothetical protein
MENPSQPKSCNMVSAITNKLIGMMVNEIKKPEMQIQIQTQIVNPVIFIIYKQLYPYIYGFVVVVALMFVMLLALLVCFIFHIKK